ncbi:MAG: hypothetical protein GY803_01940, partial [Chloroflexi bacterium]|nr:hypothetical protein [Chloroflexota bacterium]
MPTEPTLVKRQSRRQSRLIIPLLVIFLGCLTWANYRFLTGTGQYASHDYMSLWAGGRAVIEGLNPYDPAVWGPLRERYGSEWIPDAQAPFPLWTLILHVPFSLLDVGWGAAVWLTFSFGLLVASLFLLVSLFGRGPLPLGEFALLVLGAFTFRGTLISLRGGQI